MTELDEVIFVEAEDGFKLIDDCVGIVDQGLIITVSRTGGTRYVNVVEGDEVGQHAMVIGSCGESEGVESVSVAGEARRVGLKDASGGVKCDNWEKWLISSLRRVEHSRRQPLE